MLICERKEFTLDTIVKDTDERCISKQYFGLHVDLSTCVGGKNVSTIVNTCNNLSKNCSVT